MSGAPFRWATPLCMIAMPEVGAAPPPATGAPAPAGAAYGIVTLSHVVRRTKDLPTTLLALGVGLLVTIGPLVLLAA